MSEKKSFSELLGEAPMATGEKTITLTGALSRSADPGKFVLTMGDNQTATLNVDAVKQYKVLSGMVGQMIVEVEVDRDKVPNAEAIASNPSRNQYLTIASSDYTNHIWDQILTSPIIDLHTAPSVDYHTSPYIDYQTSPYIDQLHTVPQFDYSPKYIIENTGTIQENIGDPGYGGVDPGALAGQGGFAQGGFAQGGAAPFALATPHQAPQGALAGMGASPMYRTTPIWDRQTLYWLDKPPLTDITGHFPYPD